MAAISLLGNTGFNTLALCNICSYVSRELKQQELFELSAYVCVIVQKLNLLLFVLFSLVSWIEAACEKCLKRFKGQDFIWWDYFASGY